MTKLKYWNVEPEEPGPRKSLVSKMIETPLPSLSSDVKSMLHDEHSKRLDAIESTLAQWQATVWAKQIEQRVADIEAAAVRVAMAHDKVYNGLRERVAALEHALSKLHDIDNEPIFPEPLPREELD